MKKTNKTRYAILGMLFSKPRSGYQIRQFMLDSTAHFWQETDASIYPMLKKLEVEGMVTSRSEFVGKRERQIFEITQAGKNDFLAWMALPAEKENHRNELLLKLFFGATATREEMIKHLKTHMAKCQETKETFKRIQTDVLWQVSDNHPHKTFWMIALKNGMVHVAAELGWVQECIKLLEK